MKKLDIDELQPGMITAEDVFNYSAQLILPKGLVLTDKAISKLKFYDVETVRVEEARSDGSPLEEEKPKPAPKKELTPTGTSAASPKMPAKTPAQAPAKAPAKPTPPPVQIPQPAPTYPGGYTTPSYAQRVKESAEFVAFQNSFNTNLASYRNSINEVIKRNAPIDLNAMLKQTMELVTMCNKGSYGIMDMLNNMRVTDDMTYSHCLNVSLFCNVFCGWLRMDQKETELAMLCGLLHDVGKMNIPEQILKKTTSLTPQEYMLIKNHPIDSYNLLRDLDIDPHIKNVALMHHERCDGSGYPYNITSEKIDPYAKIVAIADVYDALTTTRSFRSAMSPFQAIRLIEQEGLQKFDTHFIMTFLENVMNTFIGNRVKLTNGMIGEIIFINKQKITRPTIRCGEQFIDLAKKEYEGVQISTLV